MKLSQETLSILKNFGNINPNIYVKSGNILSTIDSSETIFAVANVKEQFDIPFGIYELSRFLGAYDLFENPEITFNDKFLLIETDNKVVQYSYADPETLLKPSKIEFDIGEDLIKISITKEQFLDLLKSSSVIDLPHVSFVGDGNSVNVVSSNKKNPNGSSFKLKLNVDTARSFEASVLLKRLEFIIPDIYDIEISPMGVIHFINKSFGLQYWIAVEMNHSKF